jgi:hypothetical protein
MKVVAVLLLVLFLAGCGGTNPLRVSTTPVERAPLILPAIDQFRTREVNWFVITPENYQEVISKLQASGQSVALFAITDSGYEALSLNLSDIQTIIRQQQAIIAAYQDYYVPKEEEKEEEKVPEKNWFQRLF